MNQPSLAAQRRLVHHQIERQCRHTPLRIAVQAGSETITYRQLNHSSTRLALHLRRLSRQTGQPIGVLLAPGIDYVVSVLGILRSGGYCVPFCPAESASCLAAAVQKICPRIVVTCRRNQFRVPQTDLRTVIVGEREMIPRHQTVDADWVHQSDTSRAFLLWEGKNPTGPCHRFVRFDEIRNALKETENQTKFSSRDALLAKSPVNDSLSILEILLPLSLGGRVLLGSTEESARESMLEMNPARIRRPIVLANRSGFTTR